MGDEFLSAKEAAGVLGVTARRIRQLCRAGHFGFRIGNQWAISRAKLEEFAKTPRPVGRPPAEREEGRE